MRKLFAVISVSLAATTVFAGQYLHFTRLSLDPSIAGFHKASQGATAHEMIVQFRDAITESDKQFLKDRGLRVLGYLPEDALVVQGDTSSLSEVIQSGQHPRLRAITGYLPEFKISSDVTSLTTGPQGPELWLITTFEASQAKALTSGLPFKVLQQSGRSLTVQAERRYLLTLASLPGVEHIQAQPRYENMYMNLQTEGAKSVSVGVKTLSGAESGTQVMNFQAAWGQGLTGRDQVVAFADTGLDSGDMNSIHADFKGAVKAGQILGLFGRSWEDPFGHGTHVAGSIAGRGTSSNGALRGGAFDAQLVAQSMWSPVMENLMPPSKAEVLFGSAAQEGAIAHSNSWGSPRDLGAYDGLAQQVDEWSFKNPDTLVIFAAGNSGEDLNKDGRIDPGSIGSPATAKNCLSVGASENVVTTGGIQVPISKLKDGPTKWGVDPIHNSTLSDNANGIAMFSSRGPTRDGRIKPDLVAPGTNILSTRSHHPKAQDLWGRYDDQYVWSGGTSMSTPLVAGALAVARQFVMEKMGQPRPSSALMKAVLVHRAVDMYPGQYGEVGVSRGQEILTKRPNSDEGYGRVDVSEIVSMTGQTHLADERVGLGTSEEKVYQFELAAQAGLLANLVYHDAPASPNAAMALVNDLDLILVKPDGSRVAPQDKVNNHEVIELSNLPAGSYQLIVRGTKVPQGLSGKQAYALIWTVK